MSAAQVWDPLLGWLDESAPTVIDPLAKLATPELIPLDDEPAPAYPLFVAVTQLLHQHVALVPGMPEEVLEWAAFKEVDAAYQQLHTRVRERAGRIAVQFAKEQGTPRIGSDPTAESMWLSSNGATVTVEVRHSYDDDHDSVAFPASLMELTDSQLTERQAIFDAEKVKQEEIARVAKVAEQVRAAKQQRDNELLELDRLAKKYGYEPVVAYQPKETK